MSNRLPPVTGQRSPDLGRRFVLLGGLLAGFPHRSLAGAKVNAASLVRSGDPVLGNPKGTLTIVDFYDVRCPPCRAMYPRIQRLLAVDHQIRYVPIDYPILGPPSLLGVEALFAAQMQGRYAAMQAKLMTQVSPPTMTIIKADANELRLNWHPMELAMSGDATARRVAANLARGKALKIKKVPTLFIGTIRVGGALTYDDLVSVVAMARRRDGEKYARNR